MWRAEPRARVWGLSFEGGRTYSGYVYAQLARGCARARAAHCTAVGHGRTRGDRGAARGAHGQLDAAAGATCALLYGVAPPPPPALPCYNNSLTGDAGLCVICEGACLLAGAHGVEVLQRARPSPWITRTSQPTRGARTPPRAGPRRAATPPSASRPLQARAARRWAAAVCMCGSMAYSAGYTWKRFRGLHDVWGTF